MAQELIDKIRAAAQENNVDPDVAVRIAELESSLNPAAKAKRSSARGLFQVIDSTWKEHGGKPGQQLQADENIRVGTSVLSANQRHLREVLGRDPAPSELYAAHYFGPAGATATLTAAPGTPIEQVLPAKAIKANPNLKGKTTDQIIAEFEGKMGGKKAPAPRPTAQEPTEAEKIITPALQSGMTAKAAPDLGAGYQAALALAFMQDQRDDDEDEADKEEEAAASRIAEQELRNYKPFNALASVNWDEPMQLAEGGEVDKGIIPEQDAVQPIRAASKAKTSSADLENLMLGLGIDKATIGVNLSKMKQGERETMAQALMAAYNDRIGDVGVNANLIRPVDAPPGLYMGSLGASYPVGQGRVMGSVNAMRTPEGDTQTTGYGMGYAGRVGPGYLSGMVMQPKGNPQGRQVQLQYAVPFADGGEVSEPNLFGVSDYARSTGADMYPGQQGQFDQQDAARHMLAAGTLARKYGPTAAEMLGNLHEIKTSPLDWIASKLGVGQMPVDYEQDLHNNRLGIELAGRSASQKELEALVQAEAERARREKTPGAAWIGKPVRRAEGGDAEPTPEELAAAARPATFNAQIARQGAKTRALAAERDVNTLPDPRTYAAVSGFLGTAPDEQGFSVMHPDAAGIRQAGNAGFAAGTAAAVVPAVQALKGLGTATRVVAGKPGATAADLLSSIKEMPVGASVKPVEPFFQHMPSADAPFVGRLDEFVAGMSSPVRKDQFLGQLKGKFREYDIARAESTLADLPGDAKLTPVDLLNRLKSQYDPANMRTTVIPPMGNGANFATFDNPYLNQDVGVIHLSSHANPESLARMKEMTALAPEIGKLASIDPFIQPSPKAIELLKRDPEAARLLRDVQDRRAFVSKIGDVHIKGRTWLHEYEFPILSDRYATVRSQLEAAQDPTKPFNYRLYEDAQALIKNEAAQNLIRTFGRMPTNRMDLESMAKAIIGHDQWAQYLDGIVDMGRSVAKIDDYVAKNADKFGTEVAYTGKDVHRALKPPQNAAAFSRFVEHTVQDPERGPLKGIHVLELQSDLTSELKKGYKPFLKEKEVFPNMAENRRLVQQLAMKNSVAAAIQRGDQFVTFPGKESVKPELYKSVPENLKYVAKDLGPGFEVRPFFTLRDTDGNPLQHWGITWGPEAAQRIQKQGVPFKDGGMVERRTDDSRKYL